MTRQNKTYCRFVSIIIPALNEEKNIGRCLDSLVGMNYPKLFFEVLVIDNGSSDKTLAIAESYKSKMAITVITTPGATIAVLRNIGAATSKGEILAFIDADCTVSSNWINNALPYFEDYSIGAVGSNVNIPENSTWVAKAWDINLSKNRKLGVTECLPTGNLIVAREAYLKTHGFNENLITNEDYDFCYRLRQQELKVFSDPEISVIHWGAPKNLIEFYRREVWHGTHVFKVFLNNIKELKNWRAVAYALYFACCLLSCLLSIFCFFAYGHSLFLMVSVMALAFPSALLSLRVTTKEKLPPGNPFMQFMQLSVIYVIYGMARAVSIMKLRNWIIIKDR